MSLYNSLLERMEGRSYGHYFSTYCPWDTHKTPALLVFQDGMVKCLSCNRIWSHEQLNKKIGYHFIPTNIPESNYRLLPKWRSWEEKYGSLESIVEYAHQSIKKHSRLQTYLKERRIYDFLDEGSLGYLDNWITFPVFDKQHRLVDIVVRSVQRDTDVRYVVHPNSSSTHPIYVPSWERLSSSGIVYVVYGIIDAISLHLAGFPSLTGVTGKSLSFELLKPLGKKLIIIPDKGEESDAHKLANRLGWRAKVKSISWPENTKDVDEIRRKYGDQVLSSCLA